MKTVRCFLAVNLELKTAKKISELQQELIAETRESKTEFKWVPPQNMHVTIRFLGNITEPMIQAIKDSLEATTRNVSPAQIQTGQVKYFDADSPRVLYCEITDQGGEFGQMVSEVHKILVNIGFKELDKPYVPHVTLARIQNADATEVQQLTEKFGTPVESSFTVRTLVCYQSEIGKSGVDYKLLWKLPLKKRPPSKSYPPSEERDSAPPDDSEIPAEDAGAASESPLPDSTDNSDTADSESTTKSENDNIIGSEQSEQGEQES